nr:MATE family efflux transporter [uncultured Acetatifactor sp.]
MDNKRIVKNIGISMLMKPISMVLSFIYTPMALGFLGQEKYGIWAIILNMISWINYFDIGIGNGLKNRLTEAIANEDNEKAQIFISTAYLGTTVIAGAFCVLLIYFWNLLHLSAFFNLEVADENIDIIVFTSIIFICINFVLSLSKTATHALQQSSLNSVVSVFGHILQIFILLILSKIFHESLMAVALMYGLVSLFDNFVLYVLIVKKNPFLRPQIAKIDLRYMGPLVSLGIGFFVMQICTLVLNTTDNLLISSLYGSSDVTPYNIVYKCFYMIVQVHGIIIMPMWSAYTEAAARNDIRWIKNTVRKIDLVTLLFTVGTILGIFLFEPFAALWLGQQLEYGKGLIILVAIYMVVQMYSNNYSSFLCGIGHIRVSVMISIVGAIVNIPLSIFFARHRSMYLSGIILGSLVVMSLNLVFLPHIAHKWIRSRENGGIVDGK